MLSISAKLEKELSISRRSILTPNEISNSILSSLLLNDDLNYEATATEFVRLAPVEIIDSMLNLLLSVERDDYQWVPFMIGGAYERRGDERMKLTGFQRAFEAAIKRHAV